MSSEILLPTPETLDYYTGLLEPTGINPEAFCSPLAIEQNVEISLNTLREKPMVANGLKQKVAEYIRTQSQIVAQAFAASRPDIETVTVPHDPLWGVDIFKTLLPAAKKTGKLTDLTIGVLAPSEVPVKLPRTKARGVELPEGFDLNLVLRADFADNFGHTEAGSVFYPVVRNEPPIANMESSRLVAFNKRSTAARHLRMSAEAAHRQAILNRINTHRG